MICTFSIIPFDLVIDWSANCKIVVVGQISSNINLFDMSIGITFMADPNLSEHSRL